MVLAHLTEATQSLWLRWNFSPSLVLGIAVLVVAYFYAARRHEQTKPDERLTTLQISLFVTSVVVLVFALLSPLDALGDDYLFSAHMVQHMLLAVVFPPLFVLSIPSWMIEPLFRKPAARTAAKWIAHPVIAFTLLNADLWLWHAPALYDATLSNETLHIFEHLSFIVFGVIFWLPICGPSRVFPRVAPLVGVLYLFLGCQPMVVLGALLTFAATPFYAPYVSAPRILGSTPLGDQQLGGLIMWLPTNIPYIIALSIVFIRWVALADRNEREAAGEFDDDRIYILPPSPEHPTSAEV